MVFKAYSLILPHLITSALENSSVDAKRFNVPPPETPPRKYKPGTKIPATRGHSHSPATVHRGQPKQQMELKLLW